MMTQVRRRALDEVRRIVLEGLGSVQARVYLFGSCARGNIRHGSDIDVAVEPLDDLPPGLLGDISEQLEESDIPFFVDLVDLRTVDPAIARRVRQEGIQWTS